MKETDLEALRWKRDVPVASAAPRQQVRAIINEPFLKGPIPLKWLAAASVLSGKALHVGIVLWFLYGLEKQFPLKLSQKRLREMGIQRNAAYRGLGELEQAGLVLVERRSGRLPLVTIMSPK